MVIWMVLFVVYYIFLLILLTGLGRWKKNQHRSGVTPSVSVVVAMRNEAHNLPTLLTSLSQQTYTGTWELILVDDHSSDNSVQVAEILQCKFSAFSLINPSPGSGKKQALTAGIARANGEIIATTDADCELPPDWLADMVGTFETETQLVAGVVRLKTDSTLFQSLQAVEFTSVIATGLGMLGWNKPLMCNGASLAFRKSAFEAVNGYAGNEHIPSGDDEFLMRKISERFPQATRPVRYGSNSCRTLPCKSVSEFFEQRIRWASKWRANTGMAKLLAAVIFLFQVAWLPMMAISLFTNNPLLLAGVLLKIGLEGVLLGYASRLTQQPFSMVAFAILQVAYAPYVMAVALATHWVGYTWKGRPVLP